MHLCFFVCQSYQVNNEIFPVWTYSSLAVQVPVFLLTDWLQYKPVVILQCVALFITIAMIRWLASVPEMQVMQFFYGVATASEIGYYSYIYRCGSPRRRALIGSENLTGTFLSLQYGRSEQVPEGHLLCS